MDLKKINEEYTIFYKGQPEVKDEHGNVVKKAREPMKEALEKRLEQLKKDLEKAKDDKKYYEIAKKDPSKRNGLTEAEVDAAIENANKEIKKILEQSKNVSSNLSKKEVELEKAINEISKDPQAKEVMDYALAKRYDRKMKKNEEKLEKLGEQKDVIVKLKELAQKNSTISEKLKDAIKEEKEEKKLKEEIKALDEKDPDYDNNLKDLKKKINKKHDEQRKINKEIIDEAKKNGVDLEEGSLIDAVGILTDNETVRVPKKDSKGNIIKDSNGKVVKEEKSLPLSETFNRAIASCNREYKRLTKMQYINTVAYVDLGKILENPKSDIAKKANEIMSKSDEKRKTEESLNEAKQNLENLKNDIESNNIDISEDHSEKIKELKEEIDKQKQKVENMNNKLPIDPKKQKIGIFKRFTNLFKRINKNKNTEIIAEEEEKLKKLQDELSKVESLEEYKTNYQKAEEELSNAEKAVKAAEIKENMHKKDEKNSSKPLSEWHKNLRFDVVKAALDKVEFARTKESKEYLKQKKEQEAPTQPEKTTSENDADREV